MLSINLFILAMAVWRNVPLQFQEELNKYFASEFQGKIKSAVSKFLNGLEQELIGIDAHMDKLSEMIEPYIDEIVQDYGLKCVKFSLAGLDIDNSKYDAIDEAQIASINKVKLAQGDKGVMDVLGENWGRQQAANILGDLARNPGAGGVGSMGAGMGMGMAAGSVFGNMANQMFEPMNQSQPQQTMPSQPVSSGRFAPMDATESNGQAQTSNEDPFEVLSKLKKMLDAGLISQEQYDAKVQEVMSRM